MKNIVTIILAAGKGTRMKSSIPKVLHQVCDRPIIDYVLEIAKQVGSLKKIVVLGFKAPEVKKQLTADCITVKQRKLLGTADAVKCALSKLKSYNGDVLVLSGDTPLLNKTVVKNLIKRHKRTKASISFLTSVVHNPQGYGRIIRDDKGNAVAIREEKDASAFEKNIAEINVGVYCFDCKQLKLGLKEIKLNAKKKEFYLTDLIDLSLQKGLKIQTVETQKYYEGLGVNTREDLAQAEKHLRRGILREFMEQGVTIIDPETTHIDNNVTIGKDTVIRPFSYIENNVKIGSNCIIGPYARLRPGTKIKNNVEIGNFTEVSRSKIGKKTLMKHFSFLGDAIVGSNVNIGAGTITANFDGQNKNVTRIENNAFIGSDTILIAPVKVGRKAITGAGSVVTKGTSVPDNKIALGVPARIISRR